MHPSGKKRLSKNLLEMKAKKKKKRPLNGGEPDALDAASPGRGHAPTRVILDHDDAHAPAYYCLHGPALLFERPSHPGRPFYACASNRDQKACPFFQWRVNGGVSEEKSLVWRRRHDEHARDVGRRVADQSKLLADPASAPGYCHTCQVLFRPEHGGDHAGHRTVAELSDVDRARPTTLLQPLNANKKEAQYHFTPASLRVLVDNLRDNSITHVLCIGAPRIHEEICSGSDDKKMASLLLDIDTRLGSFFASEKQWCWYNMFNRHFFLAEDHLPIYQEFLKNSQTKLAIVTDPPFGGKCEIIGNTLKRVSMDWRQINDHASNLEPRIMWIFPYFMESKIRESVPSLKMSDYQVNYDNHASFTSSEGGGRKQGSPVRFFTNIPLTQIILPKGERYKFCKKCRVYVSQENRHCAQCGDCTSKNGAPYHHCDACERCVKDSWAHCGDCGRCALPAHPCQLFKEKRAKKEAPEGGMAPKAKRGRRR